MNEDKLMHMVTAVTMISEIEDGPMIFDIIDHMIGFILSEEEAGEVKNWFEANLEASFHTTTDEEYEELITGIANGLCGYACGVAADGIIEYIKRPDISQRQRERIRDSIHP